MANEPVATARLFDKWYSGNCQVCLVKNYNIGCTDTIKIFTDGSGHNGGIGAAAVLMRSGQEPRTLRYYLGPDEEHTVYEAEILGLTLAAQLLLTERNVEYPASILLDNQVAIQCGEAKSKEGSGYLANHLDEMTRYIAKRRQ